MGVGIRSGRSGSTVGGVAGVPRVSSGSRESASRPGAFFVGGEERRRQTSARSGKGCVGGRRQCGNRWAQWRHRGSRMWQTLAASVTACREEGPDRVRRCLMMMRLFSGSECRRGEREGEIVLRILGEGVMGDISLRRRRPSLVSWRARRLLGSRFKPHAGGGADQLG